MSRLRHFACLLIPLCCLLGCSTPAQDPPQEPEPAAKPVAPLEQPSEPVSLEGWASERIELPPEFAPEMPAGDELLLFAPGMFEPDAEDFWSYAFIMRIDEAELGPERLTEIFELYYDGLLEAVASSRPERHVEDPAQVKIERVSSRSYEGSIKMIDTFVTFEPVDLRLVIESEPSTSGATFLRIQASPQAAKHVIWTRLSAAASSLEF